MNRAGQLIELEAIIDEFDPMFEIKLVRDRNVFLIGERSSNPTTGHPSSSIECVSHRCTNPFNTTMVAFISYEVLSTECSHMPQVDVATVDATGAAGESILATLNAADGDLEAI